MSKGRPKFFPLLQESLTSQLKSKSKMSSSSSSSKAAKLEEDMSRKMEVIEKEAKVLRERNAQLESENERLNQENKQVVQELMPLLSGYYDQGIFFRNMVASRPLPPTRSSRWTSSPLRRRSGQWRPRQRSRTKRWRNFKWQRR